MKYCKKCGLYVNNDRNTCPFCYSVLDDDGKELDFQPYPKYKKKVVLSITAKIFLFISIITAITSILVNSYTISLGYDYYWSIIVIFSIVYLWIIINYVFSNRGVLTGRIITTSVLTSICIYLIEFFLVKSNSYWFSLDIVIPFIFIGTTITVLLIMLISKKLIIDTLIPLFGLCLLSMLLCLIDVRMNSILWPALSSCALSAITLIYMLVFHIKDVSDEFKKRFHI